MKDRICSILKLLTVLCLFIVSNNLFAQPFKIIHTDTDSLTLEFNIPSLHFQKRFIYGETFDSIKSDEASYLMHKGMPVLPVYIQMIGIPPESTPEISVLADENTKDSPYYILPYQQENLMQSQKQDKLIIDHNFYRQREYYPERTVEFEVLGYIREQRVGRLKIHPVQYNPGTRQIRIHKRVVVRINMKTRSLESQTRTTYHASLSNPFEQLFKKNLINYEQAKLFRQEGKKASRQVSEEDWQVNLGPVKISSDSYKITITDTGLYKLNYKMLEKAGANFAGVDVNTIKMFSEGQEVSIYVYDGEKDGRFNSGDYIVFYGKAIVDSKFTDQNVYVLSWGGNKGLRPAIVSGKPINQEDIQDSEEVVEDTKVSTPVAFRKREHFEEDFYHNPLVNVKSELVDHFFWSGFTGGTRRAVHDYRLRFPYSVKPLNREITIRLRFQGISFTQNEKHIALIKFNNIPLSPLLRWNGQENPIFEIKMPQEYISPNKENWLTIECKDTNKTPEGKFDFCLDWFEIEYWRSFEASLGRLEFSSDTIPAFSDKIRYEISGFSRNFIELFEIGEKGITSKIINGTVVEEDSKNKLIVETRPTVPTKYYAVQEFSYLKPKSIEKYKSGGLRNPNNQADYIIIVHENFIDTVDKLAEYRRQNGLSVMTVDVEEIYNEFSNGIFNPMAIKSFLRYTYNNWLPPNPSYVLLVGDAHWDYKNSTVKYYKDILGIDKNIPPVFVPTYHSWSPEGGETAMDQKFVEVSGDDALPDMFIGRLPVQTNSELENTIEKIINYEQNKKTGLWQSRIMQIADNDTDNAGDEKFQKSREYLVDKVIPPSIETVEVYLKEIVSPYQTKQIITENMRDGVVVMEYSGHGGADSWAHEGIFTISDIRSVGNKHLPFVVTTTCLNGIFDKPMEAGNRSISEEFVLVEGQGAIANLSASRLTYADANAEFDIELFSNMFLVEPPVIGAIIDAAKVDFITKQSKLWWPNVQQYTLFGDPATMLSLPRLRIEVDTKDKSLDASQKIIIPSNTIVKYSKKENPLLAEDFNATLMLSVIYPNNLDKIAENELPVVKKTIPVWDGEYREIQVDIPDRVIPGDGIIRMFASNGESSAIGGTKFSVYNPVILSNNERFSEDEEYLLIEVEIADNKGVDGVKKVSCKWHNTVNFKTNFTDMIVYKTDKDRGIIFYKLKEPIPLPKGGKLIKYNIIVEDDEGNVVETKENKVEAPIGANLTVSRYPESGSPMLDYEYSDKYKTWVLKTRLENNGGKFVKSAVWVYFFEGNPDQNGNNIVDEEAVFLGRVRIPASEWKNPEQQSNVGSQVLEIVYAELKLNKPLKSGYHSIYVWADPELPEYNHTDYIDGEIPEPYSYDNKVSILLPINDFILMHEELTAYSLDNVLKLFFPKEATEPTTVSVSSIPLTVKQQDETEDTINIVGNSLKFEQPELMPAVLPGKNQYEAFSVKLASDVKRLQKSAEVTVKFDIFKLKDRVSENTGIKTGIQLDTQVFKEASKLSIYSWMPDIKRWKKLDSQLLTDENGEFKKDKHISLPVSQNASDQTITQKDIDLDPNITPTGEWIIMFLDSQQYQVMLKRGGEDKYSVLERTGTVGEVYKNEMAGIELNVSVPEEENTDSSASLRMTSFEFGDTIYFRTRFDSHYGVTIVHNIRHSNYGDGSAYIRIKSDETTRTSPFGDWLIFLLNSEEYEIRGQNNKPLSYSNGSVIYGRVNRPSNFQPLGIEVNVNAGERKFSFGDKFKFKITEVGGVSAKIDSLSTVCLMHNNDNTSPDVQFWVNGEEAKDSSVIPPRPEISLLINDRNGIDIESFSFKVSKSNDSVNSEDTTLYFKDVPKDDYVLNNQTNTITIRYLPILYIGKYFYRISVKDLNGNNTDTNGKDYIEYLFFVKEQPDLKPPSISVEFSNFRDDTSQSFSVLSDGDVLTESSTFRVTITDEHGINPDSVFFSLSSSSLITESFSNFTFERREGTDQNYDFDFNKTEPTKAVITYQPDLPNGDYQIQVDASDISKNKNQLQMQFSMDEPVVVSNLFNVPNPFKEETFFVYELTQIPDDVIIKIYTVTGRLIRTIDMASSKRHYNEQHWDGRDEYGKRLANGTYLYKFIVQTEEDRIIKYGKLSVLR